MHLEASLVRVCGQECPPRVRAPPARISAAPALGARASGAHISSACPGCARLRRAYQQRLPRVRASGAHISSACPGCARLRRAYQQRLPWVRAPPARISAAPALGARASGAHISSACPGCARLRRAWKQRLPRVRAPPARMEAARTGASEQYRKRQKVEVSFRSIPTVSAPTQHTHTTLSLRSSF
jgi:phage FluMu protein Com